MAVRKRVKQAKQRRWDAGRKMRTCAQENRKKMVVVCELKLGGNGGHTGRKKKRNGKKKG